jgi:hypothetical protein
MARKYQTTADVEAANGVPVGGGAALPREVKTGPLTTQQHILHLLLTICTMGLWAPVWIIMAARGNRQQVR